jgi:hypothetical protein
MGMVMWVCGWCGEEGSRLVCMVVAYVCMVVGLLERAVELVSEVARL